MADEVSSDATAPPQFGELADQIAGKLFDPKNLGNVERVIANALQLAIVNVIGAVIATAGGVGTVVAKGIAEGEKVAAPIIAPWLATAIESMLGVDVSPDTLARVSDAGARKELGLAVGAAVLGALEGDGGELVPSRDAAERLVGMLAHLAIDGWVETTMLEWLTSLGGILHTTEAFSKLVPDVVQATGIDELGRLAFRPIGLVTVSKPLEWLANKTYRPNLLSPAEAARQVGRGVWSEDRAIEECARQGYSGDRIEALFAAADRYLSVDDGLLLAREGVWSRQDVLAQLRAQGWPEDAATRAIVAVETRRLAAIHDDALAALKRAYTDSLITDQEFEVFLRTMVADDAERAAHHVTATALRGLNMQPLARSDVERGVRAGILGFADYRAALRREGYSDDDSLTLEILLRGEMDKTAKLDHLQAAAAADRAAEKAARDAAAAKRAADLEASRALARRGSLVDLARAVVRGLIPIARYADVVAADHDPDTVAFMVGLVEADRAAYVDGLARADAARQRAARRDLDLSSLEQAVLEHVVSIEDFRRRLVQLHLSDADAAILSSTLAAKLSDRDAAEAKRAEAAKRAKGRSIDLASFETLVRRGHRTIADYDGLLTSLGFDDASRAAMVDLLNLEIADDEAARQMRAAAAAASSPPGLTLEQMRRAVILGTITIDAFQAWLVGRGYSSDAQLVLLDELRADVAAAEDARRRRAAADAAAGAPALPLAAVARAARLGIVSPEIYRRRLEDAGYSVDDVAIELDLLLAEIANVQDARAQAAAVDADTVGEGLTLSELAIAVRRGLRPLVDYQARALELGLSADAATTLVKVLGDELADTAVARERRAAVAGELTAKGISLAARDEQVRSGAWSIADYAASLEADGYAADDAALLAALLAADLVDAAGAA